MILFLLLLLLRCTNGTIFRVGDLPLGVAAEGFVPRPLPYSSFGKFTATCGPKFPDKASTPLAALHCLITDQVVDFFSPLSLIAIS